MSWTLNAKGAVDEIEALVRDAAASPTQRSNKGKAQVAAAKDAAAALIDALEPTKGNLIVVSAVGHAAEEGTSPYGSLSVSVHEAPAEAVEPRIG